jgi:predicted ATPase/class 3 adenylate cyclase
MPEDQILSPDRLKELLGQIDPKVLQQVMPLTGGVITMMFTDIVDSTKIKAEMGDQPYFDNVLKPHNDLMRDCISKHNGRELKTIGDAFFVGFSIPGDATACAVDIQQRLAKSPISTSSGSLKVRIGLHTGLPKVYRDNASGKIDLSGTDVDKAARVEGLARGGQVLISEETKTLTRPKEAHDWGLWELKGLGRHQIFEVLWPGKEPERPAGRPWLEPVRFLTRFVGRAREIAQIMDAVLADRLVTLRGIGGIGKTRLADEVATRVSQQFDDGLFFVELAETQNSEASVVAELVAKVEVKVAGFANEATALLASLQNRKILLLLDNFEVVMSAAPFIGKLLKGCPGLHILVTSQQLLGVDAEQQIEVEPMVAPAPQTSITPESLGQFDSFKLFCERARRKNTDWDVSPANAAIAAEILELTDGIPLSIELAASWTDRIVLAELRDGLKKKRSEFLKKSGPGTEEKRHASIEACIGWSFNLLSKPEKDFFPKLSVFVGGFFAEDAVQVCETKNASTLLDTLQGHSLLTWEESLARTRYRMLPTVQEYATEKVRQQTKELRQRHAHHFLEVLDRADNQIRGKEQMAGINRISADLDNIRAGMETAIQERDHHMVVSYSQAFATYLRIKSRFAEGLQRDLQGLKAAQALGNQQLIAGCQNNLGNAYADLPTGDRGENLKKAIACFEAAIRGYEAAGLKEEADRLRRFLVSLTGKR